MHGLAGLREWPTCAAGRPVRGHPGHENVACGSGGVSGRPLAKKDVCSKRIRCFWRVVADAVCRFCGLRDRAERSARRAGPRVGPGEPSRSGSGSASSGRSFAAALAGAITTRRVKTKLDQDPAWLPAAQRRLGRGQHGGPRRPAGQLCGDRSMLTDWLRLIRSWDGIASVWGLDEVIAMCPVLRGDPCFVRDSVSGRSRGASGGHGADGCGRRCRLARRGACERS